MKKYILVLVILLLPVGTAYGHSGRTDSNGGHNCNVGACAGTYHYHNGGSSTPPPPEPETTYTPPPEPEPKPKPKPKQKTSKPAEAKSSESKNQEGDCFVATAAYGTPLASDVQTLRDFRDSVLTASMNGKTFVFAYYQFGPVAADFIEDKPLLRAVVREVVLKPIVAVLDLSRTVWKS